MDPVTTVKVTQEREGAEKSAPVLRSDSSVEDVIRFFESLSDGDRKRIVEAGMRVEGWEVEAGEEGRRNPINPYPFINLSLIPGYTPLPKFTQRGHSFVLCLDREQLEVLACLCYLQRGELATPAELAEASAITGVPVDEDSPMSYEDVIAREG